MSPGDPDPAPPPPPEPFSIDPDTPRHPPAPPPPRAPAPGRGGHAGGRSREDAARGKGKRKWILFVAVNVVAAAIAVFWFTRSEETRRRFLEQIPAGAGGRALAAGAALAVMLVLAWLVLPGARIAVLRLTDAGAFFRRMPRRKRVLWLPAEAGLEVVWLGAQVVFALDAIAILLSGGAFLLYAIKIAKPELFPFLP
jgi:hypothetical protein